MKPPHRQPPDSTRPPDDEDLDPPPSEEELRAAESLRVSLEPGQVHAAESPDAELAEAVRSAARPSRLSAEKNRRIVDRSLAAKPKGRVIYVVFGGVASLAAMAASFALVMRQTAPMSSAALESAPAMAVSRSTAQLFPEGIPVTGGTSDRIDRIAYARAQDLRENRFARWGVR
jgi:phosphoribosylcarboxyaminoimidazole (NCAIR) mutase